MKFIILVSLSAFLIFACQPKPEVDLQYVLENFKTKASKIETISYKAHRIDSFWSEEINVRVDEGFGLAERDEKDDLFGYSFYGESFLLATEYLYDDGLAFIISEKDQEYEVNKCNGRQAQWSPAGGMMIPNIFYLDSVYKHLELTITDSSYVLAYELYYNERVKSGNITKVMELDKSTFFPFRLTVSPNKTFIHQITLSEIEINNPTGKSIAEYKSKLPDYELNPSSGPIYLANILNREFPAISFPYLDGSQDFTLEKGKLTLIDFWEAWCGPCIVSFPKVEALSLKYPDDLQVIGIATQNQSRSQQTIEKHGVSFINLYGERKLHETYGVNSFPSYFLINTEGLVVGEYNVYGRQLEEDIKRELGE